jgi:hypothetical protein
MSLVHLISTEISNGKTAVTFTRTKQVPQKTAVATQTYKEVNSSINYMIYAVGGQKDIPEMTFATPDGSSFDIEFKRHVFMGRFSLSFDEPLDVTKEEAVDFKQVHGETKHFGAKTSS